LLRIQIAIDLPRYLPAEWRDLVDEKEIARMVHDRLL
jgi:hypothetical protein